MEELAGVDGRAVYGLAGEELARFGDELDMLVVGSRGYGPLRRLSAAAPPTTWSATRAARCSCCPARTPPQPLTPRAPANTGTPPLAARRRATVDTVMAMSHQDDGTDRQRRRRRERFRARRSA